MEEAPRASAVQPQHLTRRKRQQPTTQPHRKPGGGGAGEQDCEICGADLGQAQGCFSVATALCGHVFCGDCLGASVAEGHGGSSRNFFACGACGQVVTSYTLRARKMRGGLAVPQPDRTVDVSRVRTYENMHRGFLVLPAKERKGGFAFTLSVQQEREEEDEELVTNISGAWRGGERTSCGCLGTCTGR